MLVTSPNSPVSNTSLQPENNSCIEAEHCYIEYHKITVALQLETIFSHLLSVAPDVSEK